MRKEFTEALEKLHVDFHKMGGLVNEQLTRSLKAFKDDDIALASDIRKDDELINTMEMNIEKDSIQLIALQAPVTVDLRKIITVLKASSDLERMGDHAKSIARVTDSITKDSAFDTIEEQIIAMGKDVQDMVQQVLDAYVQQDVDKAKETAAKDKSIDQQRDNIRKDVIAVMSEHPDLIESGSAYIQIAQYLERIGDYSKNVAEWVLYLDQGQIIDLD